MPDEMGLDTSITPIGWQEPHEKDSEQPAPKHRRRKGQEPPDKPSPPPADGVGTKIDVTG